MPLAACNARRPTADLDALARSTSSRPDSVVSVVSEIALIPLHDGVEYQTSTAALISSGRDGRQAA